MQASVSNHHEKQTWIDFVLLLCPLSYKHTPEIIIGWQQDLGQQWWKVWNIPNVQLINCKCDCLWSLTFQQADLFYIVIPRLHCNSYTVILRYQGVFRNCSCLHVLNHSRYRTHFRPMYKIAYKTVTELEWRCCPGYQGHDCREVKDLRLIQVDRLPQTPSSTGYMPAQGKRHDYNRVNIPWKYVKQN